MISDLMIYVCSIWAEVGSSTCQISALKGGSKTARSPGWTVNILFYMNQKYFVKVFDSMAGPPSSPYSIPNLL